MRTTTGALFIAIGISILWLAATGNLDRLALAWHALTTGQEAKADPVTAQNNAGTPASTSGFVLQLPTLPSFGSML